jgi:small-conductance mechanosensitive channel
MIDNLAVELHLQPTLLYTLIFAGLLIAALVVGFVVSRIFQAWARKFHNSWGEFVFALLATLPIPLLVLLTLYIGMESLTLSRLYERIASKLILALVILVILYFPAKILLLFLGRLSEWHVGMKQAAEPAAFMIKALFALLAVVILLDNLGVSLTAVWTTLGVGSVAVALALQDTLGNFFAGVYILADRPFRVGDFIKLDSGQEGMVRRVGWRTTILHTLGNNFVVVPNATMAKAVITNFSAPEPQLGFSIQVSVAYGTDPARVEKALLDAVAEAAREHVEGLPRDPRPNVKLNPGFGDSSLDFTLGFQLRDFRDQYLVQSELRKRILARFAAEGIEMPYPTRAVVLDKAVLDTLSNSQPKS